MTERLFKRYSVELEGDSSDDAWNTSGSDNRQAISRHLWVCDAEVDLPTADDDQLKNGDWAFAVSEGTTWKRESETWNQITGGAGAPTGADYLVGTTNGSLSAEIVVGTSPGGELGGTWGSPTVDATHSGSTHSAAVDTHIADITDVHDHGSLAGLTDDDHTQYATNAELTTHEGAADPHTGYVREADANWVDLTDAGETALHSHAGGGSTVNVEEDNVLLGAAGSIDFGTGFDLTFAAAEAEVGLDLSEVTTFTDHSARHEDGGADEISITGLSGIPAELTTHAGAADPHTGYRLESADHTHASAGAQAGQLDHGLALTGLTDDDHTQYRLESESGTFTVGGIILSPTNAQTYIAWRAPFSCTVTAVHAQVDTGTTTVVNAGKGFVGGTTEFCSADITVDPADAWEAGTVNQNQALVAGDAVYLEVITAGTATQVTIQVTLTRP